MKAGDRMPDEVRAKISAALRGRPRSREAVRLQAAARRTPREHGTARMFQKGGCRCEPCREAFRKYRHEVYRRQAARRLSSWA